MVGCTDVGTSFRQLRIEVKMIWWTAKFEEIEQPIMLDNNLVQYHLYQMKGHGCMIVVQDQEQQGVEWEFIGMIPCAGARFATECLSRSLFRP